MLPKIIFLSVLLISVPWCFGVAVLLGCWFIITKLGAFLSPGGCVQLSQYQRYSNHLADLVLPLSFLSSSKQYTSNVLFLSSPRVYRWHEKCFCVLAPTCKPASELARLSDMRQFNYSTIALMVITLRQCSHSEPWEMKAHIFPLLDQALVLCTLC